jgi:ferredoxin
MKYIRNYKQKEKQMNNIVFYFSGTGNCFDLAKRVANGIGECDIISIGNTKNFDYNKNYNSIGFIYPTYFLGLPNMVKKFVKNFHLINSKNTYYFVINTCGGKAGNGLTQFKEEFGKQNNKLNYGISVQMPSNYIIKYDRIENYENILEKAYRNMDLIIHSIKNKENNKIKRTNGLMKLISNCFLKNVNTSDKYFNINNNCTGCEICKEVCPVKNIEIINKIPNYNHKCEQCMACIQYCPRKAINYKNITEKRIRYVNPNINYK